MTHNYLPDGHGPSGSIALACGLFQSDLFPAVRYIINKLDFGGQKDPFRNELRERTAFGNRQPIIEMFSYEFFGKRMIAKFFGGNHRDNHPTVRLISAFLFRNLNQIIAYILWH